jgi:hypothetical protein
MTIRHITVRVYDSKTIPFPLLRMQDMYYLGDFLADFAAAIRQGTGGVCHVPYSVVVLSLGSPSCAAYKTCALKVTIHRHRHFVLTQLDRHDVASLWVHDGGFNPAKAATQKGRCVRWAEREFGTPCVV